MHSAVPPPFLSEGADLWRGDVYVFRISKVINKCTCPLVLPTSATVDLILRSTDHERY